MVSMIVSTKGSTETIKSIIRELSHMTPTVLETNFDIKKNISILSNYMDSNECSTSIFFECTKRVEKLWLVTEKVSIRFSIMNASSIYDLSTDVNYHKNSGHVLIFFEDFESNDNLKLTKNIIETVMAPVKDASIERALCFYYIDDKIVMRNYIIDGMHEVGPRLELELDKILDGCFKGNTLYNKNTNKEE